MLVHQLLSTNLTAPSNDLDAATKKYVDDEISTLIGDAGAGLDTLGELADALNDDDDFSTTVTNSIATKLPKAGGTMTGAIAMSTNKITGAGDPTSAQDVSTKAYTDAQRDTRVAKTGDTMSGALAMGNNKITGLATPTAGTDVTNKTYVDGILGSATVAATSATNAATSETNAATSATNAATSETNAATSATNAASSYDSFDDRYLGAKSSAPTVDNDGDALITGALYFNSTTNIMNVYGSGGWQSAGSAVNGTSERNTYTATAGQTVFAATYDTGYIDVYLNGVKLLSGTDFTATNGTSITLASGASVNDVVDIVAYGTFELADHYTRTASDARYVEVAGDTMTGNLSFGDSDKAIFGAGSDLQIWHTGSSSVIADTGTGDLKIRANDLVIQSYASEHNFILADEGGAVSLFHNNASKFATTSTGIDVTGTVTADGLTVDGTSGYVRIQDLNASVVSGTDMGGIEWRTADSTVVGANRITATINVEGDETFNASDKAPSRMVFSTHGISGASPVERMRISYGGDISFYEDTGTTAKFFWDSSAESLGIGTSSPNASFKTTLSGLFGLRIQSADTNNSALNIGCDTNSGVSFIDSTKTGTGTFLPLRFATNDTERLRITSTGQVGIGTSNPLAKLQIKTQANGNAAFQNSTSVAGGVKINAFNDAGSASVPFEIDGSSLQFNIASVEKIRIDSSGNLLVGKAAIDNTTAGHRLDGSGFMSHVRDGNTVALYNRLTSDGEIINIRKDGTTVGSIGSEGNGGTFFIGSGDVTLGFNASSDIIIPRGTNAANRTGAIDLGNGNNRFKDAYLSGGVYLGGTGSANKLDDYESGDVDISNLTFTNSGSAVANSLYDTLQYVKIGDQVSLTGNLYFDSVTSQNGNLKIPLPFANGGGNQKHRVVSLVGNFQNNSVTVLRIDPNQSFGELVFQNGWSNVSVSAFQTYVFNITYFTN